MHASRLLIIAVALVAAAGLTLPALLRRRKKKSDREIERERRLTLNAKGRMTDGALLEAVNSRGDPETALVVFYRYSVSGVEYSAAQDLSDLRSSIPAETYWPGETVTIKYDQQNPANSIVVCERWSGLDADRRPVARAQIERPIGRLTAGALTSDEEEARSQKLRQTTKCFPMEYSDE